MLLMAVGLTLTAYGTNKLTITGGEGHPGDEVTVSVSLENSDAVVVTEVKIPLNDQLKYVDGSCTLNSTRSDGHTLSASFTDEGLIAVIYSTELAPLQGTDGELFSFRVKLKNDPAAYTLTPTILLGDASGGSISCETVSGTITILSPELTVITPTTDYGHIPIRSTYTRSITLQNSGNEPLEVSGVEFSAEEFSTDEPAFTIEAGATKEVEVTYAPVIRGAISETVTFTSNAVNGTQKATLAADPFSVNELHVGSASGISDEEVTVSLTMNNMEPIVGVQCEFTLPEQLVYVENSFVASDRASDCMVNSVADGQKLTLMMYSTSNVSMSGDDGEIATFKVKLDGTNGTYYMRPENVILSNVTAENMTSATSYGRVTIQSPKLQSNAAIDMGSNPVTETATAKYAVKNTGKVTLTIDKVTFLAEGYSIAEELPISIEPSCSTEITVQYTPEVKGSHSVQMNIYTNDPLNRMKTVSVSGSIYEPNNLSARGEVTTDGYTLTMSLDNYTDIVAIQMDIRWLSGMITAGDALTQSSRLGSHSASVTEIGEGVYRVLVYSMTNSAVGGNSGELFTLQFVNDGSVNFNNSEIVIDGIVLSDARGVNAASQTSLTKSVGYYLLGDVTCDDKVNVMDVMSLSNYILGKIPSKFDERAGDATGDGKLNVMDVMSVSKIIMSGTVTKITINE